MRFIFITLAAGWLLSCNNNGGPGNEKDTAVQQRGEGETTGRKPEPDVSGCYMEVVGRDTIVARLEQLGDEIRGRMSFDNYQKDGSSGTLHGRLQGDIIRVWYVFRSEGMNSVMEIHFKKQGDSLLRAVGEVQTKGDTAYFSDPATISYEGNVLKKLACSQVPEKYR